MSTNKKGFLTISSFIIAFMLFALIIASGMALISIYQSSDPAFMSSEDSQVFNSTFNKFDESISTSQEFQSSVSNSSIDPNANGGFLYGLMAGSWTTLKNIFSFTAFINSALYGISSFFNVPSWVVTMVLAIIGVSFVFAIWSGVYRWDL